MCTRGRRRSATSFREWIAGREFLSEGCAETDRPRGLTFPDGLSFKRRDLLFDLLSRNDARHGTDLLGLVLSGSAARGMATERSDLDVYVVLTDEGIVHRDTTRSKAVDEIPVTICDMEHVPPFGSRGWWFRWSFAWAPVLLDRTEGRLPAALHRKATVTMDEAEAILVEHADSTAGSTTPIGHSRMIETDAHSNDDWTPQSRWLGCWTSSSRWRDGFVRTTSTFHGSSASTRSRTGAPRTFLRWSRPLWTATRQPFGRRSSMSRRFAARSTVSAPSGPADERAWANLCHFDLIGRPRAEPERQAA